MHLVIADTGPVNYLILIGHIDILPALFEKVILPAIVRDELKHRKAAPAVRGWITDPPSWVEIHQTAHVHNPSLDRLDLGEILWGFVSGLPQTGSLAAAMALSLYIPFVWYWQLFFTPSSV